MSAGTTHPRLRVFGCTTAPSFQFNRANAIPRLLAAIHLRFGLPATLAPELARLTKMADREAAYLESTQLAGFTAAEAKRFFGTPPEVSAALERDYLTPWSARDAEARYLKQFAALVKH